MQQGNMTQNQEKNQSMDPEINELMVPAHEGFQILLKISSKIQRLCKKRKIQI